MAVEQAALDLVTAAEVLPNSKLGEQAGSTAGKNKFKLLHPASDGGVRQMEYAEEIGMGSREYELVRV